VLCGSCRQRTKHYHPKNCKAYMARLRTNDTMGDENARKIGFLKFGKWQVRLATCYFAINCAAALKIHFFFLFLAEACKPRGPPYTQSRTGRLRCAGTRRDCLTQRLHHALAVTPESQRLGGGAGSSGHSERIISPVLISPVFISPELNPSCKQGL